MPRIGNRVRITKGGRVAATSRNLRGILDYARHHSVVKATVRRKRGGEGEVTFAFYDGAHSTVRFASYSLLLRWIANRRSWGLKPSSRPSVWK